MPKKTPPTDSAGSDDLPEATPSGASGSTGDDSSLTGGVAGAPEAPADPATPADGTPPPPEQPADGTATPDPAPEPAPLAGNRFFAWMRSLGLGREPGWVGGVCAGIAVRLGVDPLIVRGVFVVVAVLGGPALLLYAAAWLLLPDRGDKIHLEEVFKGRLESPVAGIGALILLSMLPITQGFWFAGNAFWGEPYWGESAGRALWTVVVLGLIVWFVVWVARRSGRPAPVARPAAASAAASAPTTAFAATAAPTTTTPTAPGAPGATGAPSARPAAPAATASAEEFAAWKAQQTQWKAENLAFRTQQSNEQRAASLAAQERYRVERAARREVERARHARTRSNPLYSFVAIGLSLVVGGVVAVSIGDGVIEPAGILAGLGATLGVLAVAIIVNGARGKRPGGAQGVAAIVLIPLIVGALLPHSPRISYTEDATYAPSADELYSADQYVTGVGDTVLDLRGLYSEQIDVENGNSPFSNISLVSGIGDVTVIVPEGSHLGYSISLGDGSIDGEPRDRWRSDNGQFGPMPSEDNTTRQVYLNIAMATGDLDFEFSPAVATDSEGASE